MRGKKRVNFLPRHLGNTTAQFFANRVIKLAHLLAC